MSYRWVPLLGEFITEANNITFKGKEIDVVGEPEPRKGSAYGQCLCDQMFSEGKISASMRFNSIGAGVNSGIIVSYNPQSKSFVCAGLGGPGMFHIQSFDQQWTSHALSGDRTNLMIDRDYYVEVQLSGSVVTLTVDGVVVATATLPYAMVESQVGVFCLNTGDVQIKNFEIHGREPTAFVVMQFTTEFDELYDEVVKPVCIDLKVQPIRADESYSSELIISDVVNKIINSKIIIAEISPSNPNVYYEVGYAHAIGKPTILIAQKGTKLPFDVSGFRTLFYENSIAGKRRVEEGLRKHIDAILQERIGSGHFRLEASS